MDNIRPRAFEIEVKDGRKVIVFALTNTNANNRGSRQLGAGRHGAVHCLRRPDMDHLAPEKDIPLKKGRPIRAEAEKLELENPGKIYCYHCASLVAKKGMSSARECKKCRAKRHSTMSYEDRIKALWYQAKIRAKERGIPFSLSVKDIKIPDRCPVLGIYIRFSNLAERHNSPSVDLLHRDTGYVKGNIIIVSWKANDIRRNFSPAELISVGTFYERILK